MENFATFEKDKQEAIKLRIKKVLGALQLTNGQIMDYADVFDHDVHLLNKFLQSPPSELEVMNHYRDAQLEYNNAYENVLKRWTDSGKQFEVGTSVVKDLNFWQQKLKRAKDKWEAYQEKIKEIKSYLNESGSNRVSEESPWWRLEQIATEEDRQYGSTYLSDLKGIQSQWWQQGIFATFNTSDLLQTEHRFRDLKSLLEQLSTHDWNENDPIEKSVLVTLSLNKRYLSRYQERLIAAIEWRLRASSSTQNMHYDDSFYSLKKEIRKTIVEKWKEEHQENVEDLINYTDEGHSFDLTFENYLQCLTILRTYTPESGFIAKRKSNLQSKENRDSDLIPLIFHRGTLIPSSVKEYIPEQQGWLPGTFLRYWYFFTQSTYSVKLQNFVNWLMGSYKEVALFLNETYEHVERFERQANDARKKGDHFNFEYIINLAAFRSALEIIPFIEKEEQRCQEINQSWWCGAFIHKLPFVAESSAVSMLNEWQRYLSAHKDQITKRCKKLSGFIVNDFESYVIDSIKLKSFKLSKSTLAQIKQFIKLYADESLKQQFSEVSSPLNIFKKYSFLKTTEDMLQAYEIDNSAVHAFRFFSQCFWDKEKWQSLERLLQLIAKVELPCDEKDEEKLFLELRCLFTSASQRTDFNSLLEYLANEFFLKTGDDGSDALLNFMHRHSPGGGALFQREREENGEAKYLFLLYLLSRENTHEFDLDSNEAISIKNQRFRPFLFQKYIRDIVNNHSENRSHYLPLLEQRLLKYLAQYDGANLTYCRLIYALAPLFPKESFLELYIEKRFRWLLNETRSKSNIICSSEEYPLYAALKNHPKVVAKLIDLVHLQCTGEETDFIPFLNQIDDLNLSEAFYIKRFQYLCQTDNLNMILKELEKFKRLSSQKAFLREVHTQLADLMRRFVESKGVASLESDLFFEVVEKLGSVENKESYRMLRVKHLLEESNYEKTVRYINRLSRYVCPDLESGTFTLHRAKQIVVNVYKEFISKSHENGKWSGHLQYFLEFFLPEESKKYLFDYRLYWLRSYLFDYKSFTEDVLWGLSPLQAKYHDQNHDVPNVRAALDNYFSKENIELICDIFDKRLMQFDVNMPSLIVNYMKKCMQDPAVKLHRRYAVLSKKMRVYDVALKVNERIASGAWTEALSLIEAKMLECQTSRELQNANPSQANKEFLEFQEAIISQLNNRVLEHLKLKLFPLKLLEKENSHSLERKRQVHVIMGNIISRNLSQDLKDSVLDLVNQSSRVRRDVRGFLKLLHFDKMHELAFSVELAQDFVKYMPLNAKKHTHTKIRSVKAVLPKENLLRIGLTAFNTIMMGDGSVSETNREAIQNATLEQEHYPTLAHDFSEKLIRALNEHTGLSSFSLFSPQGKYMITGLMNYVKPLQRQALSFALNAYIDYLYQRFIPSQVLQDLSEWQACSVLFQHLKADRELEVARHCTEIDKLFRQVKHDLIALDKSQTKAVSDKRITLIALPSTETILSEQELLKRILFVKSFGNLKAIMYCTLLIDEVLKRWRKVLARGMTGPFYQHSLDFGKKLILIAGNDSQKEQCIHLIDCWDNVQSGKAHSRVELREVVVRESLVQFSKDIDKIIYQYFVDKFQISHAKFEKLHEKTVQWNLEGEILDPDDLLKSHPISDFEEILSQFVKESAVQTSVMPTLRDANKLYVAFCISVYTRQLIKLWENNKGSHPELLNQFSPDKVTGSLHKLIERLRRKYDVGWGNFNRALGEIIHKDKDYFASWSASQIAEPIDVPIAISEQLPKVQIV